VATDLRYAHWGVVADLAALVPALLAGRERRSDKALSVSSSA
jgi:electron transfer flavoprotein alpha subunit